MSGPDSAQCCLNKKEVDEMSKSMYGLPPSKSDILYSNSSLFTISTFSGDNMSLCFYLVPQVAKNTWIQLKNKWKKTIFPSAKCHQKLYTQTHRQTATCWQSAQLRSYLFIVMISYCLKLNTGGKILSARLWTNSHRPLTCHLWDICNHLFTCLTASWNVLTKKKVHL